MKHYPKACLEPSQRSAIQLFKKIMAKRCMTGCNRTQLFDRVHNTPPISFTEKLLIMTIKGNHFQKRLSFWKSHDFDRRRVAEVSIQVSPL